MSSTPVEVRDNLRQKGFFINDPEAEAIGASLIAKATCILDSKRGSVWSDEKRSKARKSIKKYGGVNEETFLFNLVGHLLGRDWLDAKDHLWGRCKIDFLDDCIPPSRTGDAWLDKLTEQLPQVEVSRPHIAWGIYETAFTKTQTSILCNQANALAGPGLYDIFCVLEARSTSYPLEAAENSYMRCGCAMVNTRRSLNKAPSPSADEVLASSLGFTSSAKPDKDSFAFSIAVGPQQVRIFLDWALVYPADVVEWQMHLLRDYHFRRLDDIEQLHHDMDNILEWGVTFRKQEVIELCGKIEEQGIVVEKPPSKKVEITEDESS